jgi:hypothetical protein
MTTPDEVAAALAGTPMAHLPTGHGPEGTILVRDIAPGGVLEAWEAAYARMPVTGRWPVMVSDDFDEGSLDLLPEPDASAPSEAVLSEFDHATRTLDPWSSFERDDEPVEEPDFLTFFADGCYTHVRFSEEASQRFELPTTVHAVERWAYERVLSEPALVDQVRQDARWAFQTSNWHTPDRVSLLLLPTTAPWLAAYWVDFYGSMGWSAGLGAVLRQWHEQYGARLVAGWGTMLQLLVDRPPTSEEQAWTLAGQLLGLTTHLEAHQWELAVALPEGAAWFLHNRP